MVQGPKTKENMKDNMLFVTFYNIKVELFHPFSGGEK